MPTVLIASKLPNALILQHPKKPTETVTIAGVNSSRIFAPGSGYSAPVRPVVTTEVDANFWETWKPEHATFKPLTSGAIFEVKSESHAKSIAIEQAKRKTGLEPMSTDGKDSRAPGVLTSVA